MKRAIIYLLMSANLRKPDSSNRGSQDVLRVNTIDNSDDFFLHFPIHYYNTSKRVHKGIIQCFKWFTCQELSGFRNHSNGTWYLSSYVINMLFLIYLIFQLNSQKCCILYFVNLVTFNLDNMFWLRRTFWSEPHIMRFLNMKNQFIDFKPVENVLQLCI